MFLFYLALSYCSYCSNDRSCIQPDWNQRCINPCKPIIGVFPPRDDWNQRRDPIEEFERLQCLRRGFRECERRDCLPEPRRCVEWNPRREISIEIERCRGRRRRCDRKCRRKNSSSSDSSSSDRKGSCKDRRSSCNGRRE